MTGKARTPIAARASRTARGDEPERLTDRELIARYQETDGGPGDPLSDALLAEIERRELDL